MAEFLGLQIDRSKSGTVTLTQTGLIEWILSVIDMEDCNKNFRLADKVPLIKDEDGDPCRED